MTTKHLTEQRFSDLDLIDTLKQGIADAGFEFCTPIQEKSLPVALAGNDVAGQAQTGTGKTVAFLLACCQRLQQPVSENKNSGEIRALILAPTRELAIQIYKDAEVLVKHTGLKMGLIYGGTGYDEQKQVLANGVDILIGTPGRLIDFYKQKLFGLNRLEVVVLDEADRMFDLGFIRDIRYLFRRMPAPEQRLNMLFSATLSFRVMELAYEHMNNPEEIKIESDSKIADKIEEFSFYPADDEKSPLLVNLIKKDNVKRALVFVNTRHAVEKVSSVLAANDISTAALSGEVPQKNRERLLQEFKDGKKKVLVATDVAARGLHIADVSHVYNYDLPQDVEDYVHRIGRTARAGQSGVAVSFLCEKYAYSTVDIEEYIGHTIEKRQIESWMVEDIAKGSVGNFRKPKSSRNTATEKGKDTQSKTPQYKQPEEQTLTADNQASLQRPIKSPQENVEIPYQSTDIAAIKDSALDDKKPKAINEIRLPKNRFSRKFGVTPLVG